MPKRTPPWDVTKYVVTDAPLTNKALESHKRINLVATLTWGLTNTQI